MATTTASKKAPAKAASTATKATAKTAKKAPATKAPATKSASTKATSSKSASKKPAAKKAPAKKAPATKAPATVGERLTGRKAAKPKALVVAQAEAPWSKAELSEVRTELEAELRRLTQELELAEQDLLELVSSSIDSQGDEADAGSFSNERQHEMTLAENSRALLVQTTTALGRITDGTYGQCEVCSEPIGKMRLQAFPRATLCMPCKQHQERR
ncbi:TraR/DksA family transcriptional regulator [Kytococcus sedentarius]|uniref:TraR/DksA family transcriptional regulator n=1 Tax=Kytococcus sedentarius TaxID=1276 RepID=UPI003850E4E5